MDYPTDNSASRNSDKQTKSSKSYERELFQDCPPDCQIVADLEANKTAEMDALACRLNGDYLSLLESREFRVGKRVCKAMDVARHIKIGAFADWLHQKRISKDLNRLSGCNSLETTWGEMPPHGRIAVYTCITGGYDCLAEPAMQSSVVDYYAVTDSPIADNSRWTRIPADRFDLPGNLDDVRRARWFKTHPHVLFADYQYSIWLDGSLEPIGDVSVFLRCIGEDVPFATSMHPYRNCIYSEAEACILHGKGDPALLHEQINAYRQDGMPKAFGLPETNVIVREHCNERCILLMEYWWAEIVKWSHRDQLSLPYAMWKMGLDMDSIGFVSKDMRRDPRFRWNRHSK